MIVHVVLQPRTSFFPFYSNIHAEVRFIHQHQIDNPDSKVSLQADVHVQAMKERIKLAGTKAIYKFLPKYCASTENDRSMERS